jgi:hypothetical protein
MADTEEKISVDELVKQLASMSEAQKLNLLDNLQNQLGIQKFKSTVIKDTKVKKKTATKKTTPKKKSRPKKAPKKEEEKTFNDEFDGPDGDKIAKISKELNKNRKAIKLAPRKKVSLVKVTCKNCNRVIEVAENFPDIKNFICCIK